MANRKKSSSKSEAGDVSRSGSMPDLTTKALQIVAPGVTRLDVKPAKPSRKRR